MLGVSLCNSWYLLTLGGHFSVALMVDPTRISTLSHNLGYNSYYQHLFFSYPI